MASNTVASLGIDMPSALGLSKAEADEVTAALVASGVSIGDAKARTAAIGEVRKSDAEHVLEAFGNVGALARGDVDAIGATIRKAEATRLLGKQALDAITETAQRATTAALHVNPRLAAADLARRWEGIADDVALPGAVRVRWSRFVAIGKADIAQSKAIADGAKIERKSPRAMLNALTSGAVKNTDLVALAAKGKVPDALDKSAGAVKARKAAEPKRWSDAIADITRATDTVKSLKSEPSATDKAELARLLVNLRNALGAHKVTV